MFSLFANGRCTALSTDEGKDDGESTEAGLPHAQTGTLQERTVSTNRRSRNKGIFPNLKKSFGFGSELNINSGENDWNIIWLPRPSDDNS